MAKKTHLFLLGGLMLAIFVLALMFLSKNAIIPENKYEKASLAGINWLIKNQELMSDLETITHFQNLLKISTNNDKTMILTQIIAEKKAKMIPVDINIDVSDISFYNWHRLEPLVQELIKRKCAGQNYEDAKKINFILDKHSDEFIANFKGNNAAILVAIYFLNKIGVSTGNLYDRTLTTIKNSPPDSKDFSYALTHIIFTKSDYFSYYLESKDYPWEIENLNTLLSKYALKNDLTDEEADIASELLISSKLLRLPPTAETETLYKKLAQEQNPDGSWGSSGIASDFRIHLTALASIVLMPFPDKLGENNSDCQTN